MAGAGASAQREYERRARRDRERRREALARSLTLVAAAPLVAYVTVRLAAVAFDEWAYPRLLANAGGGGTDEAAESPLTDALVDTIAWSVAFVAALRVAVVRFGRRHTTGAGAKGAAGERATGRELRRLPEGYRVVPDVRLPGSRANIDHVVIGPTGVFTIETKNYASRVIIRNGTARRGGRSLAPVVAQVTRQAEIIANVVGLPVRPIVCVHGGGVDAGWSHQPKVGQVRFCSGGQLSSVLRSGERSLSASQVDRAASTVGGSLRVSV